MPEEAKPNRRRGVIFTTVFAIVLGGIIYYLWTNHAYLKLRFVGGEPDSLSRAVAMGHLTHGQIVTLVNSGATRQIRIAALRYVGSFKTCQVPYDDRTADAIRRFAANIPDNEPFKWMGARAVARQVGGSGRPELFGILEMLASDTDPQVRGSVARAFGSQTDFGEKGEALFRKLATDKSSLVRKSVATAIKHYKVVPDFGVTVLCNLLGDADETVRSYSIESACYVLKEYNGSEPIYLRLRESLYSAAKKLPWGP